VGLFVVLLLQSLILAFMLLDFVLLYNRTEHLCARCGQISTQRTVGLLGRMISKVERKVPTAVSHALSPASCQHHFWYLSETDLFLAGPNNWLIFQSKPRRYDISRFQDALLVEALQRLPPVQAPDALQWVIEAAFQKNLGVITNWESALRSQDLTKVVSFLRTAPESDITWQRRLETQTRILITPASFVTNSAASGLIQHRVPDE
jgi:hypothetical protein